MNRKRILRDVDEIFRIRKDLGAWLWRFELLTRRPVIDPVSHPDTWCRYLVALMETGHERWCDWVWQRYLKQGGEERHFARYFPLAVRAVLRGCTEESVRYNASVWTRLSASHEAGALRNLVAGKSVAVVGNGPQEVGKSSGAEIDAHDIVVRINNYDIAGRESDYGRRTDVWVKNTTPEMRHVLPDPGIKMVVYSDDWSRERLALDYQKHIGDDLDNPQLAVDFCDHNEKAFVAEAIDAFPTAGASVLAKLRLCSAKRIDVYGFSVLQSGKERGKYERLPDDVNADELMMRLSVHEFDKEVEFLRRHFRGRRFKVEKNAD